MAFKFLVNAGLIAIPVGGSLGALFGIDAHRSATGQAPLFRGGNGNSGGSTGGGSGGSGHTINNGLTNTIYCEQSFGISPPSQGELFTLNPNQWGVTATSPGALCMNVTTYNNETYPTKYTAPEWSTTWQFDPGPSTQPVYAYPNIMLDEVLPIALEKMTAINLDLRWTYGVGNTPAQSTSPSELAASSVNTNVAIDMFFDPDSTAAQNSAVAKFEVMVWFAQIGPATQPIGTTVTTRTLNGTSFQLYAGINSETKQNVMTWVASETTDTFTGDIYPLIADLYSLAGPLYPSSSDYMGVFQFGTEAYSSSTNVTFWCPELYIDIQK